MFIRHIVKGHIHDIPKAVQFNNIPGMPSPGISKKLAHFKTGQPAQQSKCVGIALTIGSALQHSANTAKLR